MNTIICMQSPIITHLARKIDEYLNTSDTPVTKEARSQFLSRIMKVDFTTLHPVRSIECIGDDPELFNAYLEFSNAVIDSWTKPPSISDIVVLTIDGVNVRIALTHY